jgi:hypothetical protein
MLAILTISAALSSGALVFDDEINVAANKYCKLQDTTTIMEMLEELTPAVDSILMVPRLMDDQLVREGKITSSERYDRQAADSNEVRDLIRKRAAKKCPKKE